MRERDRGMETGSVAVAVALFAPTRSSEPRSRAHQLSAGAVIPLLCHSTLLGTSTTSLSLCLHLSPLSHPHSLTLVTDDTRVWVCVLVGVALSAFVTALLAEKYGLSEGTLVFGLIVVGIGLSLAILQKDTLPWVKLAVLEAKANEQEDGRLVAARMCAVFPRSLSCVMRHTLCIPHTAPTTTHTRTHTHTHTP